MDPAGRFDAKEIPPLTATNLWKSPVACGAVSSAKALMAPADCPINVTLPALPPNRAMLPCTNRSACTTSSSA